MTLYSLTGLSVKISVTFEKPRNRKINDDSEDEDDEYYGRELQSELFKEFNLQKFNTRDDIILKNIRNTSYKYLNSQRENKQTLFAARRQIAKQKHENNSEYMHKKKVFLIHKWDIIRDKKREADMRVRRLN